MHFLPRLSSTVHIHMCVVHTQKLKYCEDDNGKWRSVSSFTIRRGRLFAEFHVFVQAIYVPIPRTLCVKSSSSSRNIKLTLPHLHC